MHDKPVSLIAMDMDGTLLDSRQRLTPGNLAALRKAQAAGIHLAICSGRLPGDVAMFLDEAGLPDCAILSLNGAYCLKRCMEGEFFNHPLENATLEAAVGDSAPRALSLWMLCPESPGYLQGRFSGG